MVDEPGPTTSRRLPTGSQRAGPSPPLNGGNATGARDAGIRPRLLDVRRLATLQEVARAGSFAGAAQVLSYTPSAVSQQMCALERQAGVVLFERDPRGVSLTQAGRAVLTHAEVVLAHLAEAEAELDVLVERSHARLRFGCFSSATSAFGARAFEIFGRRYASYERCFMDGEPYESLLRLGARELDLAVIFKLDRWPAEVDYEGVTVRIDDGLEAVPLFDDPYLLILPREHVLAARDAVALTDIAEEPILVAAPWWRDFEALCNRAGFEPKLDFSCRGTGFEALQTFASTTRGLTLMPRLALGWLREDLVARPLESGPVRRVQVATPARAPRSAAMLAMLGILSELSRDLSERFPGGRECDATASLPMAEVEVA